MSETIGQEDTYAGDEAWREWFEVCSVAGCSEQASAALRREVVSAMRAQLTRYGVEAGETDDPVAFFDAYFTLKGSRTAKKPLKAYFEYRLKVEKLKMSDFVCGTLFGARSGRIRDIVLEWITVLKGWRAHSRRNPDGTRRLEWERATESGTNSEAASVEKPVAAGLDRPLVERDVERLLVRLAEAVPLSRERVAVILYAVAMDVPMTDRAVLKALDVGKSLAYQLRNKVVTVFRSLIDEIETATDESFGEVLLERCAATLPPGFKLGGRS